MNTHCVIFRTGGTENFKWRRSLAMTKAQAISACAETKRMGYVAMVENYKLSVSAGLPETYEYVSR